MVRESRSERAKWDRFIAKNEPLKADAFFWCRGVRWEGRRYCVVLSAKAGYKNIGLELCADTAAELAKAMRDAGYRANATKVARLCEGAGCSPKQRRK